jgi:hypothetical protein
MDRLVSMKINQLLQAWPRGTVALHPWLKQHGVSHKLAEQYRRRGWIDAIGRGAFVRRGDKVEWPGAIFAMQTAAGKPVHPGGRTALELHGFVHYLRPGPGAPVYLYGAPGVRLPTWFRGYDWRNRVYYTASGLFSRAGFLTLRTFGEFAVDISSPERAILEYLDGFPAQASFEEARQLLESLTTLRPEVLQSLLEACTSVKVKRMFLYLADQVSHRWRAKLKDKRIKLGSGKRLLVRGGTFDPRYLITVPTQAAVSDT